MIEKIPIIGNKLYPYDAFIFAHTAKHGVQLIKRKAKTETSAGDTLNYKLSGISGDKIIIPKDKHVVPGKKRDNIFFEEYMKGKYKVLSLDEIASKGIKFTESSSEMELWSQAKKEAKILKHQKQSFWDQYASMIGLIGIIGALTIMVFVFWKGMKDIWPLIAENTRVVAQNTELMKLILDKIANSCVSGGITPPV